jgi:mannose PTS system EIIA component
MTGVILLGHGTFPSGLRDAAELILGPNPRLQSFGLDPDTAPEVLRHAVSAAVGDSALLLVDLHGGTPSNVAAEISARNRGVRVVAGANLPMVLAVLSAPPDAPTDELAAVALRDGGAGVVDVSALTPRLES